MTYKEFKVLANKAGFMEDHVFINRKGERFDDFVKSLNLNISIHERIDQKGKFTRIELEDRQISFDCEINGVPFRPYRWLDFSPESLQEFLDRHD